MMSKKRSKNILGLSAILIMLHHLGQRTSASWLPAIVRRPGLELFVPIGYLLVSFFFFCSGYGLIKSMRTKENYFNGFLVKRLNRILMIFIFTQVIYLIARVINGVTELPLNPYSWYIYTIIILYIGFFLIYRKENKNSLALMGAWILGYSIICYILIKGNWWINSAPVFLLGIYMAEKESGDDQVPKKRLPQLIPPAIIFVITFVLSENINSIYHLLKLKDYGIINIVNVILQIVACSCFSLVIYRLACGKDSHKTHDDDSLQSEYQNPILNILSKVLSFYGSMTLEFYLIHGLFVQLFGHHFMNDSTKPVYYIKNVLVYVLVVFVLSTVAAFILKKIGDIITGLYSKSEAFIRFCKDQKRITIIILILIVVITVGYSVYRHRISADIKAKVDEYDKENLTHVNVNGTDVAVYDVGEGTYSVVLLGADDNPCPTLYLRPLADNLSDSYRVLVIDYPGKGYSGEASEERTTEYFADVIHLTLSELGVSDNIILAPNQISSIYAFKFMEKYPEGVAGFAGIDAVMPAIATHFVEGNYNSVDEYRWYTRRITRLQKLEQKMMTATGYVMFQTPVFEYLFYGSGLKEYYPVMEEMFIRRYMQSAHLNERKNVYDNCMSVTKYKLPSDLPSTFIIDNYLKENNLFGINWVKRSKAMITNEELQTVDIVTGDPYIIYYNPDVIAKKIDELVARIP